MYIYYFYVVICMCAMSSISWYLLHLPASARVQVPRVGQGRQGGDGGGLVEGLLVLELLAPWYPEGTKNPRNPKETRWKDVEIERHIETWGANMG